VERIGQRLTHGLHLTAWYKNTQYQYSSKSYNAVQSVESQIHGIISQEVTIAVRILGFPVTAYRVVRC
jgi:hypothetical protein